MSHECARRSNAILGFSEILRTTSVDLTSPAAPGVPPEHSRFWKASAGARHDVLDLSKIEAGRMELAYDRFGVQDAVKEVHNVIRFAERAARHRPEHRTWCRCTSRSVRTRASSRQVLYNLPQAMPIKFTPQGGEGLGLARTTAKT